MSTLELGPIRRVHGTVRLPGSKSISNRTLLLAALADGDTRVHDVLESDDTRYMLDALRTLGVSFHDVGPQSVRIAGTGGVIPVKNAKLFLGNAGTAFRPLTAVLALAQGEYMLSGVARMHERPIGDLVEALRAIGARIDYLDAPGFPPLQIHPGTIAFDSPVKVRGAVSSQYVTALLLALPLLRRRAALEIEGDLISKPYVELTLATMRRFGVDVEREGWSRFVVPDGSGYSAPRDIYVEGDASSASYFLAAGLISGLHGGGPVRVEGVGRSSIQGDVRFTDILEQMGGQISMGENWIEASAGPAARSSGKLNAIEADVNHIPDAAMTAAVAALFADGPSTLRNIASWRVKETDRLSAMATELRKLGAAVEEGADFLRVAPPAGSCLRSGASIDTYDDHRMAMCFSLAALGGITVRINNPECVGKTFPQYFEVFKALGEEVA